jgi:leader peptidase (prepilin peptidase)/N-methyltransferase
VILNEVALAGIVICGVAGVLLHGSIITLIGGVSGFLIMLVLYYLGRVFVKVVNKIRGSSITEDDALGFGDVNLSGLLGLLLGWQGIFAGLFFGILVGGLVSGFYLVCQLLRKRYTAYHALPYAPFLIIGALLLLYLPN